MRRQGLSTGNFFCSDDLIILSFFLFYFRIVRSVRIVEPGIYKLPIDCINYIFGNNRGALELSNSEVGKQRNKIVYNGMVKSTHDRVRRSADNEEEGTYVRMIRAQNNEDTELYNGGIDFLKRRYTDLYKVPRKQNIPAVHNVKAGLYGVPLDCVKFMS